MLRCRVDLREARTVRWRWETDRLVSGRSWLAPFRHPALAVVWTPAPDGVRLVIEAADATRGSRDPAPSDHALDRLDVTVSAGTVTVVAGVGGAVPLYLAVDRGVVHGSWRVDDLHASVRADRLLDRAVTRILTRQLRYGSDTVFVDAVAVTERATATATARGLTVAYPEAAEHVLAPRRLRHGLDAVEVFDGLLDDAVRRRLPPGSRAGIELSGGVDSSNVAVSAARTGMLDTACGLIVDDEQRARRDAVTAMLRLDDVPTPAAAHPPFAPTGVRRSGVPHDPAGAFYREAFDALRDSVHDRVDVMLTGLGGDELLAVPTFDDRSDDPHRPVDRAALAGPPVIEPPWLGERARAALGAIEDGAAPPSVLPLPVLMQFALHNPAYLDVGVWPVSPLADARLGRFAEQLPVEWRRGKELLRRALERHGLPTSVTRPPRPENFSDLMQLGLRRHGLPLARQLLRESVLIELGFVDRDGFAEACDAAERADRIPSLLCDTIALECGIRAMTGLSYPSITPGERPAPA